MKLSKELVDRLCSVLIRCVGDTKECPKCKAKVIIDDPASQDAFVLYKDLAHIAHDYPEGDKTAAAIMKERERCAKLCDARDWSEDAYQLGKEIRAGEEAPE